MREAGSAPLTPTRGLGSLYYLRAVALHIAGQSHEEIGENLGISRYTVASALNSPEGLALIAEAKRRIRENVFGQMEAKLVKMAQDSLDNLADTVEAKFAPGSRGKIHQDNVGLKLLGILGYTEESLGDQRRKNGTPVSDDLGERLLKALEKANQNQEEEALKLGKEAFIVKDAELIEESDVTSDQG